MVPHDLTGIKQSQIFISFLTQLIVISYIYYMWTCIRSSQPYSKLLYKEVISSVMDFPEFIFLLVHDRTDMMTLDRGIKDYQ